MTTMMKTRKKERSRPGKRKDVRRRKENSLKKHLNRSIATRRQPSRRHRQSETSGETGCRQSPHRPKQRRDRTMATSIGHPKSSKSFNEDRRPSGIDPTEGPERSHRRRLRRVILRSLRIRRGLSPSPRS